jgi:glycosyltransferase involved in cell wall biosynthesis
MANLTIYCPATLPEKSGAGINAFNLAKEFIRQGNNVSLFCFQRGGYKYVENVDGVSVCRIPINYKNIFTKNLSYLTIIPVFLFSLLRSDAGIVFGPMQGYLWLFATYKLFRKKIIFRSTMFGTDDIYSLTQKWGLLFRPIKKYLLSNIGTYMSTSPAMTKSLKDVFGDKVPYIETAQGVDTTKFKPLNENQKSNMKNKLAIKQDCNVIVSVGHVIERKGLRAIFDSLAKLNDTRFVFIVVGEYKPTPNQYIYGLIKEMSELHSYGTRLLGEKVLFTGSVSNTSEYLQAADFFVINSSKEGIPNVLLEAMSTGLPSIVRRLEGVDNYITYHDENSKVVDSGEGIYDELLFLLDHPQTASRLGRNAREFIKNNFSLQEVARKLIKELTYK